MRRPVLSLTSLALALLLMPPPANASFVIDGNAADRATFVGMLNTNSRGGAWSLNMMNQLVFTRDRNNPVNFFASRIGTFNTMADRTVEVRQSFPGVLVGSFGPLPPHNRGNGVQLLDLGDIQQFRSTIAQEPLLDLQASVLMHELAETFVDGGADNFPTAHEGGITEQNSQLTALGSRGQRIGGIPSPDNFTITGRFATFATYRLRIPWRDTGPGGVQGFEVIDGRITGGGPLFNYSVTNIARGLSDTGLDYDGTGFDVTIDSVTFQAVPEPATLTMLGVGAGALLSYGWRRRKR